MTAAKNLRHRGGLAAAVSGPAPGRLPAPSSVRQLAAATIGAGGVAISPLQMALMAGVVQSGTWHRPVLVTNPPDPGLGPRREFQAALLESLRSLCGAP